MDRVGNVFHCVRLHSVARAATVVGLLSAAVDVHHSVARVAFPSEITRVFGASSFVLSSRPGDALDDFRRVLGSTLEDAVVVLRVGEAPDVRMHSVLDFEHDDVLQSLAVSIAPRQE